MSFLSDLLGGGSKVQSSSSNSNVTNTQIAGGDLSGVSQYGEGNTLVLTDQGAVSKAFDLGQAVIDSNNQVAFAGLDNAQRQVTSGFDFASGVAKNAIDGANYATDRVSRFAVDALDANNYILGRTLDTTTDVSRDALNSLKDANSNVLDFATGIFTDALHAQSNLADQNLIGVTGLASQVSQSATQSVNDSVVKLVTVVAIAVAIIFVFKGAK